MKSHDSSFQRMLFIHKRVANAAELVAHEIIYCNMLHYEIFCTIK